MELAVLVGVAANRDRRAPARNGGHQPERHAGGDSNRRHPGKGAEGGIRIPSLPQCR
jgi:hypothetical protein